MRFSCSIAASKRAVASRTLAASGVSRNSSGIVNIATSRGVSGTDRTNGRSWSNQKPLHRGSRTCRPFAPNQGPFKEDRGFIVWLGRGGSAPSISTQKQFRNPGQAYRSDDYSEAKPAPPGWSKRQEAQAITQGNKSAKDEKWSCEAAVNATATGSVD